MTGFTNLTDISFGTFHLALKIAVDKLEEIQSFIDLLNAKGGAGLKDEFKKKDEDWQDAIAKKFGYRINPELTLLRSQHKQLQVIRDAYISIVDELFQRKLSPADETAIKTRKKQFETLKEKRDIENSHLLKMKKRATKALGFTD